MAGLIKKILKISLVVAMLPAVAFAIQQQNPRGNNARNSIRSQDSESNIVARRATPSVVAKGATSNGRQKRTVVVARSGNMTGTKVRAAARNVVNNAGKSRTAAKSSLVRSAGNVIKKSGGNLSRAARATAVFNDVTKIGGGYSNCRDSYATCMDQFCANANDTYRRCFCSDRFNEFRDTADKLDAALQMLAEFQDNNLNAVDKTAAEVNAMYSASEGEAAIKRDTSASQKLLDSIGDVLSGKSSVANKNQNTSSLGVLDFTSFGMDDDIFSGGSSIFDGVGNKQDLSSLEGKALYDAASRQCTEITREACKGDAMFNLARSAYSIMITQDCNAYEKNINAKKANVEETVRTAEKYLREARLEEYRAHNSQDVNECLGKVESAMRQSTACGPNYEKCMDYTGLYINTATGEPIYSKALFGLTNLIKLDQSADILGANKDFDKFLDDKKMFATTALDTCRSLADTVWYEFKRSALIQIAQAQDEKIEAVKSSCVEVMKECYDTQTGAIGKLAGDTSRAVGAISTITARDMCKDRVLTCAALYGDPDACQYDDKTKKLSGNGCGLQSLLALVDTVDSVNVAKGCEQSLRDYANEICAPASGDTIHKYPWGCRLRAAGRWGDGFSPDTELPEGYESDNNSKDSLYAMFTIRARDFCDGGLLNNATKAQGDEPQMYLRDSIVNTKNTVDKIVAEIREELDIMLSMECESVNGFWIESGNDLEEALLNGLIRDDGNLVVGFYANVFNGRTSIKETSIGRCVENSAMLQCSNQNTDDKTYATWDASKQTCVFSDEWYGLKCSSIGGYYMNAMCYVGNE